MKQFAVTFAMNKDKEKDYNLKKKKEKPNKQAKIVGQLLQV